MARVVVVGGGFGGLAAAVRLAKLGHEVTLVERSAALGGPLSEVVAGEFAWDAGPTYTLLPAVVRDLFRKSGRPVERELDLVPLDVVREHRFEDGSSVRVPSGRAAQLAAFDELGPGSGSGGSTTSRRTPTTGRCCAAATSRTRGTPDDLPRDLAARLDSRETLFKRLKKTFKDERLRLVAGHPFVAEGHDLRNVPAWAGLDGVRRAAVRRLDGRGRHGPARRGARRPAGDPEGDRADRHRGDRPRRARRPGRGGRDDRPATLDADVVVCAIDPRRLPALAPYVERTMPAIPPVVATSASRATRRTCRTSWCCTATRCWSSAPAAAPAGASALTVHGRGRLSEDILRALARHRIDVRAQVVARVDLSPRDQVERWGGSPMGVLWQGRATVRQRLGPRTPIDGRVRRRRARDARRRAAVRGAVGRAGGRRGRSGLT